MLALQQSPLVPPPPPPAAAPTCGAALALGGLRGGLQHALAFHSAASRLKHCNQLHFWPRSCLLPALFRAGAALARCPPPPPPSDRACVPTSSPPGLYVFEGEGCCLGAQFCCYRGWTAHPAGTAGGLSTPLGGSPACPRWHCVASTCSGITSTSEVQGLTVSFGSGRGQGGVVPIRAMRTASSTRTLSVTRRGAQIASHEWQEAYAGGAGCSGCSSELCQGVDMAPRLHPAARLPCTGCHQRLQLHCMSWGAPRRSRCHIYGVCASWEHPECRTIA